MANVVVEEQSLIDIANAIRTQNETTNTYKPSEMANAILDIPTNEVVDPTLQEKIITPTTSSQIIEPDENYDGLSKVTINGVTSAIDSDIKASNIKKGVNILGVTGTLESGITPTGTMSITSNGTYDVTNYASANVNVASSGGDGSNLEVGTFTMTGQTKAYTNTEVGQVSGLSFTPSKVIVRFQGGLTNIAYGSGYGTATLFNVLNIDGVQKNTVLSRTSTSSCSIRGDYNYFNITIIEGGFKIVSKSDLSRVIGGTYEYIVIS